MSAPTTKGRYDPQALDAVLGEAAVLDTFGIEELQFDAEDAALVSAVSRRATRLADGRLRLSDGVRAQYLRRLVDQGQVSETRERHAATGRESARQRLLDAWLSGESVDWQSMQTPELRIALQVLRWIDALPAEFSRPDVFEVEGRLRQLERLEPLKAMARGFRDRSSQLSRLRKYASEGHDDGKPLMLYGVGGAGKSALVAKFLLEMDKEKGVNWVHLDLDSNALEMKEPSSLLEEMLAQLTDQQPDIIRLTRAISSEIEQASKTVQSVPLTTSIADMLVPILNYIDSQGTFVVVLDTFEQAQSISTRVADDLLRSLQSVLGDMNNARLIVSGRVQIEGATHVKVAELPKNYAVNLLRDRSQRRISKATCEALVKRIGCLPLTILLVADVLNAIPEEEQALLEDLDKLGEKVDDERIQGFLYTRLLEHLAEGKEYRRLAHATLAFPAFTEDLLVEVAPVCRIPTGDIAEMADKLEREVAFIRKVGEPTSLWFAHRQDLREHTLPLLEKSLANEGISLAELQARGRDFLAERNEDIPPKVREMFDETHRVIDTSSGIVEKARTRLNVGDAAEARDILLKAPRVRKTTEGARTLALAHFELGEYEAAGAETQVAISAALRDTDVKLAVDGALFAADWLDTVEGQPAERLVDKVLAEAPLNAIDRLRLMAARAAARRRRYGIRTPDSAILEAWHMTDRYDRESDLPLLGRIAGLLGTQEPATIHEALETVGLRDLDQQDWHALAFGLQKWDSQQSGSPDEPGPLAWTFGVALNDDEGWLRVLESRGGNDVAGMLIKAMYGIEDQTGILETLQQIYAARDDRALVRPHTDERAVADDAVHDPLTSHQRYSLIELISETYSVTELTRLAFDLFTERAAEKFLSPNSDAAGIVTALLDEAQNQQRLPELLQRFAEDGGSTGLDSLIREILAETTWDDRSSPEQVETLLENGDIEKAEELVGHLMRDMQTSKRQLPASIAWNIYRTLRNYRRYDVLQELTSLLLQTQPESARYASMHGVALTEAGKPSETVDLLLPIRNALVERYDSGDTLEATELAMLEGALGQACEDLYLNVSTTDAGSAERYLDAALEYFTSAWQRHPETGADLGVRALALRSHQVKVEQADREAIYPGAETAVNSLIEYLPTDDERWAHSIMVEIRLGVGDVDGAIESCRDLLASPDIDRFWLERLRTRLERVWLLDQSTRAGTQLLPILRVREAQLKGGSLTLDERVEGFIGDDEKLKNFEKVWGTENYRPMAWMRSALQVARRVGRIETPDGAVGTGVLIDGDWVGPGLAGEKLFLTAAHVCSSLLSQTGQGASPLECHVTFVMPGYGEDGERLSLAVTEEVLTSPVEELNVTLLRLAGLPQELAPPMEVALPDARFTVLPGDRVSVVGYPHGGELSFSITDGGVVNIDESSLMYTNPTSPGSSGSPVFDSNWRLIGLHQAADMQAKSNIARRMDRIIEALRKAVVAAETAVQSAQDEAH